MARLKQRSGNKIIETPTPSYGGLGGEGGGKG